MKFSITSRGNLEKKSISGTRVVVPTFEIFSSPTIKISSVKIRAFNLIDRSFGMKSAKFSINSRGNLEKSPFKISYRGIAAHQIQVAEDEKIFEALDAIASTK